MSTKKGLRNLGEYRLCGKYAIHPERFFSRIVEQEDGCHVWTGGTHKQGYGMFNLYDTERQERRMNVAHRIAMMLALGRDLERDEYVIHEFCDNQLCCNPAHLTVGSGVDRNRVQYAKGHYPKKFKTGNKIKRQNRNYKYTDDEMRFIRDSHTEAIAERFGISRAKASHIRCRIRAGYKWLE